jgi:YD repeat-containing protein
VGSLSNTYLSWNNFLGLASSTPNIGASSGTAYDNFARPTQKTVQAGSQNVIVNITYPTANTTVETIPATGSVAARWTRTTMDGFGRPVKVESGKGALTAADPTTSVVETVYEPCACTPTGKVRQTSRPYAGNASATAWTVYTYDALGRTISVRAPDGASTTTYEYKGETVKVTDASGKWKLFAQDAFGNLAQVNEPNPAGGADYVTSYEYNMRDQLTKVTMPRPSGTQIREFGYDSISGLLVWKQEPETDLNATDRTSMGYDSYGRLVFKTDAKNQMVEFDYDQYNRVLTMKKYLPPASGRQSPGNRGPEAVCEAVTFTYDDPVDSGYQGANVWGRLSSVEYAGKDCSAVWQPGFHFGNRYLEMYAYNAAGQVTKKRLRVKRRIYTSPSGASSVERTADLDAEWAYDSEGRMNQTKYPVTGTTDANRVFNYGFDDRGRPKTMTDAGSGAALVSNVTYGISSELLTISGGGWSESRQYNVMGQMTRLTTTVGASTALDIGYEFPGVGSNNGKVAFQQDYVSGERVQYLYDSLQRLQKAETVQAGGTQWGQQFGYL